MSVVIETTLGDITVDLFIYERPRACLNFLKLCKIKYYNFNLFHTISRGFIAQTGDPSGTRTGGESIFAVIDGPSKRYFEAENEPRIKHTRPGLISFVGNENLIASQFFLTLGEDLTYLDEKHCVFGEVVEGFEILESINEVICDNDDRPFQDVRITHTVVLDDPYPDPQGLRIPSRSPSPSAERLAGGRIAPDEEVDEISGKSAKEVAEMQAEREAKARATILEMVGDIPDAEMAPPENVLFVCKLNPVTNDDDLEIIFSRFGKIKSCEVIRDRKSGDSLQYAFIEFEEQKACEDAYFKMDNVLVDDRRIHVDFSQSVSRVKWLGKGKGVAHFDEKGNKKRTDMSNDIGKGNYKMKNESTRSKNVNNTRHRRQSRSPRRNRERSTSLENPKKSIKRKNSRSPRRNRERSTSLENLRKSFKRKSRSPTPRKHQRRQSLQRESISPKRMKEHSRSPIKRSRSPIERQNDRSPQRYTPKRDNRTHSSKNRSFSPRSRKNMNKYSPDKRRGHSRSPKVSSKRRSRSPRGQSRSPSSRSRYRSKRSSSIEDNFNARSKKSEKNQLKSTRKSRSPSKKNERSDTLQKLQRESKSHSYKNSKSNSPGPRPTSLESKQRRRNDSPLLIKHSKKHEDSKNDERFQKKEVRKSTSAEDKICKSSKYNKNGSPESSTAQTESKPSNSKSSFLKNKKAKKQSSKKKKTKKYDSSEESDSDSEDKKKIKKKKYKKRAESSTESSSSTSSSSSSEEMAKKSAKKRKIKKQIRKKKIRQSKNKKRKSSSDSSNSETSDSTSSSSKSESINKKKIKKKKTNTKSESD